MDAFDFITYLRQAGFTISLVDGNLIVRPASQLDVDQRQWIRDNKVAIVAALNASGKASEPYQQQNERVLIHIPALKVSSGRRIACDMTVPCAHLKSLREVIRFTLKEDGGGGSLLGSPGKTESELRSILVERYGDRLASVTGKDP
jgi:hypothetical protein